MSAVQPAQLTLEWLGLTPGRLDGEGGVDALGIWRPHGLELRPSSAARSASCLLRGLANSGKDLDGAPAFCRPGCQSTCCPAGHLRCFQFPREAEAPVCLWQDLWEALGTSAGPLMLGKLAGMPADAGRAGRNVPPGSGLRRGGHSCERPPAPLAVSWQHPRESDETLRKLVPSTGCPWPRAPSLHAKTSSERPSCCLGSISHLEAQLWGLRRSPRSSLTF